MANNHENREIHLTSMGQHWEDFMEFESDVLDERGRRGSPQGDGKPRVQHETLLEGPILEDVEETIAIEEVDLGISPPNTELDEGEFEDLDIEHVDVEDFLEDLMELEITV
ncbi:hypothetical protein Tco_0771759 [Tanacetum coccineum]|uniref:Uncharacterized protein n=1 Tax=Tanacetum coccineum TaxID=301880 RepID=A0ABQ4ZK02_9ASTR